jgi:hypothetical protein
MDPENRARWWLRLIFQNIGGFLSLAGIIFAAGILYGKIEWVSQSVTLVSFQQDRQQTAITDIKINVEILKEKVNAIEAHHKAGK